MSEVVVRLVALAVWLVDVKVVPVSETVVRLVPVADVVEILDSVVV